MTRIIYACPDNPVPSGGVKVIYKHAELLRKLGHEAYVMHFNPNFERCTWFDNTVPVLHLPQLRLTDLVIVPEVMTALAAQLRSIGIRYCMFVQGGYLVLPAGGFDAAQACYRHAEAVLAISDDTSSLLRTMFPEAVAKIVRVQCTVDATLFRPGEKALKVTYMPRKLAHHSANVVPWLSHLFPDWQFVPLHGLTEAQVAAEMCSSRVFLAFSDLEGFGVPPIEAAIAGNVVLGNPGWGGDEYWQEPNFRRIGSGDVRGFVRAFYEVAAFATHSACAELLAPGTAMLSQRYGPVPEADMLIKAILPVLERVRAELRVSD